GDAEQADRSPRHPGTVLRGEPESDHVDVHRLEGIVVVEPAGERAQREELEFRRRRRSHTEPQPVVAPADVREVEAAEQTLAESPPGDPVEQRYTGERLQTVGEPLPAGDELEALALPGERQLG